MARIGNILLDVAGITEESAVKFSTHEVAIYPQTFGNILKVYATSQRKWEISTAETPQVNVDVYKQLERLMFMGESLPIDLPEIDRYSVGFIVRLRLTKTQSGLQSIQISVLEGLRNPLHSCDSITDWLKSDSIELDTADFKEGKASVKWYNTTASSSQWVQAPISLPPRFLSTAWIAFWLKIDNIDGLSSIVAQLIQDANNYLQYDFKSQVTNAGKWLRIRFQRKDMTRTGNPDWSLINAFKITASWDTTVTRTYWIDDICAYQ
jgi:hypothetical protein